MNGSSSTRTALAKATYISLNLVIDTLEEKRLKSTPIICILDCCRVDIGDNRWPRGDPAKNEGALSNVCIMYATANGHVARDGNIANDGQKSTNGVFTKQLLKYMDSDLTLNDISIAIAKDLKEDEQVHITSIL
jgi:hypothetical protein